MINTLEYTLSFKDVEEFPEEGFLFDKIEFNYENNLFETEIEKILFYEGSLENSFVSI